MKGPPIQRLLWFRLHPPKYPTSNSDVSYITLKRISQLYPLPLRPLLQSSSSCLWLDYGEPCCLSPFLHWRELWSRELVGVSPLLSRVRPSGLLIYLPHLQPCPPKHSAYGGSALLP